MFGVMRISLDKKDKVIAGEINAHNDDTKDDETPLL